MPRRRSIYLPGVSHTSPIPNGALVGNLLVSGGISGARPETGEVPDDPAEQARLMFGNVEALLAAAGGTLDDVVKVTLFVRDRALRAVVDPEWTRAFPDPEQRPARHTLTAELPEPMAMQVEVIALLER